MGEGDFGNGINTMATLHPPPQIKIHPTAACQKTNLLVFNALLYNGFIKQG